jgi:hypothetical protein
MSPEGARGQSPLSLETRATIPEIDPKDPKDTKPMPPRNQAVLDFLLTRRSRPAKTLGTPVPDHAQLM